MRKYVCMTIDQFFLELPKLDKYVKVQFTLDFYKKLLRVYLFMDDTIYIYI